MARVRLLIVDDEPLARSRLRGMLEGMPSVEVVGEAGDGREAVEKAASLRPDTVLMDIAMPVMDGLEAARHLGELDAGPAVIFCTAYDEHALAAFDAAAVDYLLKPVRKERLEEALRRAGRIAVPSEPEPGTEPRSHLCARLRGSLRMIPIEDVRYLQADEKYVVVHHTRGEDLIEESLKSLEAEFGDRFLRIHRNCLVARDALLELRRDSEGHVRAVLRDDPAELEVSRRCVPQLREKLRS